MVPSEQTERDDQIQDGVESDEYNVSSNVYVRMLVQEWLLMNTIFFTQRPSLWSYTGYQLDLELSLKFFSVRGPSRYNLRNSIDNLLLSYRSFIS